MEIYLQFNFELWPGWNDVTAAVNGKFIFLLNVDIQLQSEANQSGILLFCTLPFIIYFTTDVYRPQEVCFIYIRTIEMQRYLKQLSAAGVHPKKSIFEMSLEIQQKLLSSNNVIYSSRFPTLLFHYFASCSVFLFCCFKKYFFLPMDGLNDAAKNKKANQP